jgi:Zn-dependent protease
MALVALAGPGANLLMLVGWALMMKLIISTGPHANVLSVGLLEMGQVGIITNAVLMLLNILPIPPLDGSRVIAALLPGRLAWEFQRLEPYGLIIVMLLMISGLLGRVLYPAISAVRYIAQRFIGF